MDLYISSAGIISAAGNSSGMLSKPEQTSNSYKAVEPDYTGQIPPMQLRRMSKAVRMGIGAAKFCLQNAGTDTADAVSVGTAMGCLQDTEIFLKKMVEQNEQMLTPTAFIQSTHNTVAGQIALIIGSNGHNLSYVQRGHSFEHAMINARLYLNEHPTHKILVGGIDELTPDSTAIMQEAGVFGGNTQPGEAAVFFYVSNTASPRSLRIQDITTFETKDAGEALTRLSDFTAKNNVKSADLLLLGDSGDRRTGDFYARVKSEFDAPAINFKELCGEYATSSSFALGLLADIVNGEYAIATDNAISNVLLINNHLNYISYWYVRVV